MLLAFQNRAVLVCHPVNTCQVMFWLRLFTNRTTRRSMAHSNSPNANGCVHCSHNFHSALRQELCKRTETDFEEIIASEKGRLLPFLCRNYTCHLFLHALQTLWLCCPVTLRGRLSLVIHIFSMDQIYIYIYDDMMMVMSIL